MPEADQSLVIKGGRVIDATGERDADVLIAAGEIVEVGPGLKAERELDASGCVVSPGLVDLHVHLREPGGEDAETIETGARAAALGGFTAIVAMPNTEPPHDEPSVVASVLAAGARSLCDVHAAGCITEGRAGTALAPMGELHALGVRIFTDDGACVDRAGVMRRALEYARSLPGAVVAQHAEDSSLADGGHMHEGEWSSRLGIAGRPAIAESAVVARDCLLAEATGARVHFLHLSTAVALDMVRGAKARGLAVTAEAAPHHFTLTDAACASFDPAFKVHPPLRSDADVAAVKQGLADGTIDAIATDHAPHAVETKERPFEEAPPGMLGLETALAVTITELVGPGVLTMAEALALLSWRPAAVAGMTQHGQPVAAGAPANVCVIDPALTWEVDPSRLASKSRNTPYSGRALTGRVRHTVLRGTPVVVDGEPCR